VFSGDQAWADTPLPGIQTKVLSVDKGRGVVTMLIRASAGAVYPSHRHSGPEECYVIRGSVVIDGRVLHAGDFHHADADSDHGEITTTDGAEVSDRRRHRRLPARPRVRGVSDAEISRIRVVFSRGRQGCSPGWRDQAP
jgi:hypothetical protein